MIVKSYVSYSKVQYGFKIDRLYGRYVRYSKVQYGR
jgi:hypothetical protein